MDHTHICRTRVSTNHLESQIDFLPFDVLTKRSIGIRQQKTIGQFSRVINAWSGFSAPSVVVLVISIVGKVSLTRKSFKLFYLSTTVLLSHVVSSQTKVSSAPLECVDVYYAYRLHANCAPFLAYALGTKYSKHLYTCVWRDVLSAMM